MDKGKLNFQKYNFKYKNKEYTLRKYIVSESKQKTAKSEHSNIILNSNFVILYLLFYFINDCIF